MNPGKNLTLQQKIEQDPKTKRIKVDEFRQILEETKNKEIVKTIKKLILIDEKKNKIMGINDKYFVIELPIDFDHRDYFFQDEDFQHMMYLDELKLYHCNAITDDLIDNFQCLDKITLIACDGITHELLKKNSQIKHLTTSNCNKLNQNCIGFCKNLTSLSFNDDSHERL